MAETLKERLGAAWGRSTFLRPMLEGAVGVARLPGDVMAGRQSIFEFDSAGRGATSESLIQRATDTAMSLNIGSSMIPAYGLEFRAGIKAFHASDKDFPKFDKKFAGSGQGSVRGRGLYFSEVDGVAKTYLPQGRPGTLYEVNINADPSDFVDLDTTVGKQSASVLEKLRTVAAAAGEKLNGNTKVNTLLSRLETAFDRKYKSGFPPRDDGGKVVEEYWQMMTKFKDGKAYVSHMLTEAGIPGAAYLDQHSASAGKGTRNFVIFDDALLNIVNKIRAERPDKPFT